MIREQGSFLFKKIMDLFRNSFNDVNNFGEKNLKSMILYLVKGLFFFFLNTPSSISNILWFILLAVQPVDSNVRPTLIFRNITEIYTHIIFLITMQSFL